MIFDIRFFLSTFIQFSSKQTVISIVIRFFPKKREKKYHYRNLCARCCKSDACKTTNINEEKKSVSQIRLWMPYLFTFIYLGFYIAFNTVQVISQRVVGRAEETSTYSLLGFCTVNCRPTASNYQLSHLRLCWVDAISRMHVYMLLLFYLQFNRQGYMNTYKTHLLKCCQFLLIVRN